MSRHAPVEGCASLLYLKTEGHHDNKRFDVWKVKAATTIHEYLKESQVPHNWVNNDREPARSIEGNGYFEPL